ncbi:MAG: SIMPL domain-containing protein [Pseudomonadales bacterium]|nr:SIMPL domain-containing protein [Pseudomonadales bacterium]
MKRNTTNNQRTNTMRNIILVGFLSIVSLPLLSAPEIKGSPQELKGFLYPTDKIVTISGEAEETAYSDKAIVSLVITTENKLLSEAISKNGLLRENITGSLAASGISLDSIKSSRFSSSPQYGWLGSKPSSFKVVNRMAISITNESHLKEIAAVADQSVEIELSDTAFEHTQKDEFNEKVKASALEKILKQKDFYEKSLGVKLVPVGIRDSNVHHRATRGAMVLEEIVVTAARLEKPKSSSFMEYQDQPQEPSFDEVRYQASMSVDFKIED